MTTKKNMETKDTTAAVAAQSAAVAAEATVAKKGASRKKSAPKGRKVARAAKPTRKAKNSGTAKGKATRTGSKTAQILDLIGREKGATLAEIVMATGWQAHSVRGFLSTAGKKHNVKIESEKNGGGGRVYRIAR